MVHLWAQAIHGGGGGGGVAPKGGVCGWAVPKERLWAVKRKGIWSSVV